MRYSIGRISLLAGLLALPLGASAQADAEQGASRLERWHPEAFVDPEKPVLQLDLHATDVEVALSEPRTVDGYTLEDMNARVERTRIGVAVSTVVFVAGAAMAGAGGVTGICFTFGGGTCPPDRVTGALIGLGSALAAVGLAGAIASGVMLARRKRERTRLTEAGDRKPARVQWDPAQSRFVF